MKRARGSQSRSHEGTATRAAAAQAVAAVLSGSSLTDALPPRVEGLDERDRAFARELAYGTIRWWPRLAFMLDRLMQRRPEDQTVFALLGCGLYQSFHMRVPVHAAVSATVSAAPSPLRPLCNGVLRNAERRRAELEALADADEVARTAHPAWLLDALRADWPDEWQAIVDANNAQAPMTLRVRDDRDEYMERLAQMGLAAAPCRHAAQGVTLERPVAVERLPGFADGAASVQDEAAQFAAELLDAGAGMRVLDACAAPGGKTAHILERTGDLGGLVAVDIDAARMQRVADTLTRLRLPPATLVVGDAARPSDWWDGAPFDRILLDAPCSGTGVIRRHPDIRLLRRAADIAAFAARQAELLDASWPLLAPGGRLVYATCSVSRAENDAVVAAFAARADGVRIEPLPAAWGRATRSGRQVLPGEDAMDGFHYACLSKEAGA